MRKAWEWIDGALVHVGLVLGVILALAAAVMGVVAVLAMGFYIFMKQTGSLPISLGATVAVLLMSYTAMRLRGDWCD
jgi:hypothetical protein